MAKCKGCGAEILYLRTEAGKMMPVNAKAVTYEPDPAGKMTFLGPQGIVERGKLVIGGGKTGYIPHWTTCPVADQFRRQ